MSDEKKFNEITEYLFGYLEQHSLYKASEYLALKVLTQSSCTVHDDLAKQLESYRAMKKGNIAPDILFEGDVIMPGYESGHAPQKLSDISSSYTLIIFGASWCARCAEEISQILPLYDKWISNDIDVIFVSLDVEKEVFKAFTSILPFISICDYQQWDNNAIQDFHVFATPTMFLLDNQRTILLRPSSVQQMDSWVDWHIQEGYNR